MSTARVNVMSITLIAMTVLRYTPGCGIIISCAFLHDADIHGRSIILTLSLSMTAFLTVDACMKWTEDVTLREVGRHCFSKTSLGGKSIIFILDFSLLTKYC